MTVKKIMLTAAAALLCAANLWAQPAGSPVATHGKLSVKNGAIVDKNDEPFQLRGMSFFWSNPDWEGGKFYTAANVKTLTDDWKVNAVRIAMNPSSRGAWETVLDAAISNGIYAIVDWHTHDAGTKSAAQTFFKSLSDKHKNTPNVIYEIFNEPCPSGNAVGGTGNCSGGDTWAQVRSYSQDIVTAIRNNNDQNIIVIGSPDYSKRVDQAAANPVNGANLVYAVHYYTAEPGTQHQSNLRSWCNTAANNGLTLLVTEFGVSEADGGQNNPSKINTGEADVWFDWLDTRQIGWFNWSINDKNEAASALTGNNLSSRSASGTYIYNKLRFYANTSYALTVGKSGEGTVTHFPNRVRYTHGYPVGLKAVPASGWSFIGWESNGINAPRNTQDTTYISMTETRSAVAVFDRSANLIKNGTFTLNTTSWTASGVTNAHDNYQLKVTPTSGASSPRVMQTGISLTQGRKYQLSFRARGQSARPISVSIGPTSATADPYMPLQTFQLTATMQEFKGAEFSFGGASVTNAVMRIEVGDNSGVFFLDDVVLLDVGAGQVDIAPRLAAAKRITWSVSNTGGGLTLRGPAEAGSKVTLYDVRGKAVKSLAAKDGLTLGKNIPAGNYIVVVRNAAGKEALRERVSMVR